MQILGHSFFTQRADHGGLPEAVLTTGVEWVASRNLGVRSFACACTSSLESTIKTDIFLSGILGASIGGVEQLWLGFVSA